MMKFNSFKKLKQLGLTLIELLVSMVIGTIVLLALMRIITQTSNIETSVKNTNQLTSDARFAMQRMVNAASATTRLLLPLPENPTTVQSEANRDLLAVALDHSIDSDQDGWSDANNDKDFLDLNNNSIRDAGEAERIDEDFGKDMTNDGKSGIIGIDDNNDGQSDEEIKDDDDEDTEKDEDPINGIDDDGDGAIDEDPSDDMNKDGQSGTSGIDDDLDGKTDEGKKDDDDEDEDANGGKNEDWIDAVVYYLNGTEIIERFPVVGAASGAIFQESVLVSNVTEFKVERFPQINDSYVTLKITLTLETANTDPVTIETTVRAGEF